MQEVKEHDAEVFFSHIENQAENRPNAVAIVFNDEVLTYQELDQRANQLAHFIFERQLPKNTLIGVFLNNSPESVICQLAIWKAGHAFILFNPADPPTSTLFKIKDATVKLVITSQSSSLPHALRKVNAISYEEFLKSVSPAHAAKKPSVTVAPEDLAYVIYTSGTTGMNKGVAINHRGLLPCMMAHRDCLKPLMNEKDVMAQLAPCTFDASIAELLILGVGGALAIVPDDIRRNSQALIQYYRDKKVTLGIFTPEHLRLFGQVEHLAGLRGIFIVGEYFSKKFAKRWMKNNQVFNGYGLTETTVCFTIKEITQVVLFQRGRIPLGQVVPGSSFRIENDELYVSGKCLASGYVGHAAEYNEQSFIVINGERYYKTGDKVRKWWDESIEFAGRADQQKEIQGQRVDLVNLAIILRRHVQIAAAVVDGELNCYLVPQNKNKPPSEQVIRQYADKSFPSGLSLQKITFCEVLPTKDNMKKDIALRASRKKTYTKNESDIAIKVDLLWRELLKIDPDKQFALEDSFYHFGGDEKKREMLRRKLCEELNVDLSSDHLIRFQTFGAQIRLIKILQETNPGHSGIVKLLSPKREAPNLFCVHSLLGRPENDYVPLVERLSWNVYSVTLEGFATDDLIPFDFESFAECYALAIRQVQQEGPYFITGFGGGAAIAVATAQVLEDLGYSVYVHLMDGFNPILLRDLTILQHAGLLKVLAENLHYDPSEQDMLSLTSCSDQDEQISTFVKMLIHNNVQINGVFVENLLAACQMYDPDYGLVGMILYRAKESLLTSPSLGWVSLKKTVVCDGDHFTFMSAQKFTDALQENLDEQFQYHVSIKASAIVLEHLQHYHNIACTELFCQFLKNQCDTSSLRHLKLTGSDLSHVNLTDADLCDSKLDRSNFDQAVLLRTNLYGCSMLGARNLTPIQLAAAKGLDKKNPEMRQGPPQDIDQELLEEARRIAGKFRAYRAGVQSGHQTAMAFFQYATDKDVSAFQACYGEHLKRKYQTK